jgi:hypothetical protein
MVLLLLNWVQQKIKQVSGSNPPTERAIKFTTMARNECERTGVWRLAVRNKIFLSKSQNYPNYCLMRMKIEKGRNYREQMDEILDENTGLQSGSTINSTALQKS